MHGLSRSKFKKFLRKQILGHTMLLLALVPIGVGAAEAVESDPFVQSQAEYEPLRIGNLGRGLDDEFECRIEPHLLANVGSPVEGILSEVLVERGDLVRRGQVIARLHSEVEAATLELKTAQEEFSQRTLVRNEDLYRKELIPESERDEMQTQARIASLDRELQRQILLQRDIRSPFDGVVTARFMAPGERVFQEPIVSVAQIDPLNVEVIVRSDLFESLKIGMQAEVTISRRETLKREARVVLVDPVIDAASGTFGVRLGLENSDRSIPAGIKCSLRFLNESAPDT